jgi:hypothetical protein
MLDASRLLSAFARRLVVAEELEQFDAAGKIIQAGADPVASNLHGEAA